MRATAALLAAAALVPAGAAAAAPPAPSLDWSTKPQFVVTGAHFKAGEQVTVIVTSAGLHVGHAVARDGAFRTSFGSLKPAACGPFRIFAIGNRGSRAIVTLPARLCHTTQPAPLPGTSR